MDVNVTTLGQRQAGGRKVEGSEVEKEALKCACCVSQHLRNKGKKGFGSRMHTRQASATAPVQVGVEGGEGYTTSTERSQSQGGSQEAGREGQLP